MEKIGVVTVTYNSSEVIDKFLEDLFNQKFPNFFLYVVDNASTDNSLEKINKLKESRVKIIKNSINKGVASANNKGIASALKDNCSHILLLNNDVEFRDNLFEILINSIRSDKYSLVSPKINFFDNQNIIWYAGGFFNKYKGFLPTHIGLNYKDEGYFNKKATTEYASTCCLLIKKEVFNDIGLMDEKYFVYFDDTDFLYRVLKDNRHKLLYNPSATLYHKVGSLSKSFMKTREHKIYRSDFFLTQNIKNHIYFLRKIGGYFAFVFCLILFFKNNIRFLLSPRIKLNLSTFILINKAYLAGWRL